LLKSLDTVDTNYIHIRAEADRKTAAEVIRAMIRRKMAARISSTG